MSIKALSQYCHTWITYRSACRATLVRTDKVTRGTISHVRLRHAQQTTNVQATETCLMNTCVAQTHIQLIQTIDPASGQAA